MEKKPNETHLVTLIAKKKKTKNEVTRASASQEGMSSIWCSTCSRSYSRFLYFCTNFVRFLLSIAYVQKNTVHTSITEINQGADKVSTYLCLVIFFERFVCCAYTKTNVTLLFHLGIMNTEGKQKIRLRRSKYIF